MAISTRSRNRVGARLGPVDIAFVGIGENGHLAFNDPPADFETEEPYLIVELDEACRSSRWARHGLRILRGSTAGHFDVGASGLQGQEILRWCRTRARPKRSSWLEGEIRPMAPASILRTHPATTVYLDTHSAALLNPADILRNTAAGLGDRITRPSDSCAPLVDLRDVVRLDGHQLHRPADALAAGAIPKAGIRMDQCGLRQHRDRLPSCILAGQTLFGRLMDRIGTRRGLTISVVWYSVVSVVTSLANGFAASPCAAFCWVRASPPTGPLRPKPFPSGFPSASAPSRRRSLTAGLRRGSGRAFYRPVHLLSLGGAPAFVIPGVLGPIWLVVWRRLYARRRSTPASPRASCR